MMQSTTLILMMGVSLGFGVAIPKIPITLTRWGSRVARGSSIGTNSVAIG